MDAEAARLEQADRTSLLEEVGPLSRRAPMGTVREDYSDSGDAWSYFSHDQARSRAYRWGEDGLAGISDDQQLLCFAIALWNGDDPILKERLFGLTNGEGNHGEDVKEYYFYRGSMFSTDDASWICEAGMRVITMDEFELLGRARVIEEIGRVIGDGPTYVSFDIDGLDAVHAMGTGVPEVGGYSVRDAQVMLQSLRGRHLVGADLCEVAPMYDPTGHAALNAANLLFELLCVVADSRVAQSSSSRRACSAAAAP